MTSVQYYERVYIAVLEKLLILLFWPSERELLAMLWRCLQREFQLNFQLVWFYDTVLISCMKPKLGSYKRLFFLRDSTWSQSSLVSFIFQRLRFITHYKIKFKLFGVLRWICYLHAASEALFLYWLPELNWALFPLLPRLEERGLIFPISGW